MNKFIITEEEKSRILDMHKSRTSELYLNEAQQSVDLLTKEKLAQQMMGTTPAEISAAIKKFTVKDGKGKSLGSPDGISRTRQNDIRLTFSKKPQLFDYGENIKVSYNNTPLRQTSKLTQENEGMGGVDYCQAVFSYQPEGLPSPMAIFVQFIGSKMKDVGNVASWGKDAWNKAKTQANNATKQYAKNDVTVTRSGLR